MAQFVNKPAYKWSRKKIAERVYSILSKYADFSEIAKHNNVPFEDQQIYLDSLDLVEISMYLENDFQIELNLDPKYFANNYTPRNFIDFMCKKLNTPETPTNENPGIQKTDTEKPRPQHTTNTDIDILMHSARPAAIKRNIRRTYGINIPMKELHAVKKFTELQEIIRCTMNNKYSK